MIALLILSCASRSNPLYGLREYQKTDLRDWETEGQLIVKEKDPAIATKLSFFFGLGAFYTGQPVLGVVDLLTWPVSILWEPFISPAEANKINYEATKHARARRDRLKSPVQ